MLKYTSIDNPSKDWVCIKCGTVNPETTVDKRDSTLFLLCAVCGAVLDEREEDWDSYEK